MLYAGPAGVWKIGGFIQLGAAAVWVSGLGFCTPVSGSPARYPSTQELFSICRALGGTKVRDEEGKLIANLCPGASPAVGTVASLSWRKISQLTQGKPDLCLLKACERTQWHQRCSTETGAEASST